MGNSGARSWLWACGRGARYMGAALEVPEAQGAPKIWVGRESGEMRGSALGSLRGQLKEAPYNPKFFHHGGQGRD